LARFPSHKISSALLSGHRCLFSASSNSQENPGAERILKVYLNVTTSGFAAAVYEELIILLG
jgi:hypothetical protein